VQRSGEGQVVWTLPSVPLHAGPRMKPDRSISQKLVVLVNNLRVFGVLDTARAVLAHLHLAAGAPRDRFDERYGVSTNGIIEVERSDLDGPNREHATQYQATHEKVLRRVLDGLRIDHREFVFVDLGSGKGRAMLMASEYPYARIVGVELSPACCEVARENVRRFAVRNGARLQCPRLEVICADVCDFEFPREDTVLYLFNPFRRPVLERVISALSASLRSAPRRVLLAYCNPWAGTEVLAHHGFRRLDETQVISPDWSWSLWERVDET